MKSPRCFPITTLLMTLSLFACDAHDGDNSPASEEIQFTAGRFDVHGEVLTPHGRGPFGLVIMVHGDGPAYMNYFAPLKKSFLDAGYATLMWDKPGFGKSTGSLSEGNLQEERAEILAHAIERMKSHPKIRPENIGVWGISQAGYVIPRAIEESDDISFMILAGVAGENGIQQSAYYIKQQLMCEGVPEEEAILAEAHFAGLYNAGTFAEYYSHAKPLVDDQRVRRMGFVTAMWTEDQWVPHKQDEEAFYNPIPAIRETGIPTLVFLGSLDKNVDPVQAVEAYESALDQGGNRNYAVRLIAGSDHNIIISETGCASERNSRSRKEWANYDPDYLKLMENWLSDLSDTETGSE